MSDQVRAAIDRMIARDGRLSRYRVASDMGLPQSLIKRFMEGGAIRSDTLDQLFAYCSLEVRHPPAPKRGRKAVAASNPADVTLF